MANLRELAITGKRIELTISDDDPNTMMLTAYAVTRDEDGVQIVEYQQDITEMLTEERRAILGPLIMNVVRRIMSDRKITDADLEEGRNAATDRRARELEQIETNRLQQEALIAEAAEQLRLEHLPLIEQQEQEARERQAAEGHPLDVEPVAERPPTKEELVALAKQRQEKEAAEEAKAKEPRRSRQEN